MNVVIVESPSKAKTINKYLGRDYEVLASFGHVRDLAAKDGSVDPADDFAMKWEVDGKSAKRLSDIARAVKDADKVILATDPDREGEAISWHVLEVLKSKKVLKNQQIERVVFNAITKQAVTEAMAKPRQIDSALVDAYLARRALDYLVGFSLSPVLWRKLPGARSAGRVQSVALRLVCDREMEIEKFIAREYWSLIAHLKTAAGDPFTARLVGADGKKITRLDIGAGDEAHAFKAALDEASFRVASVEAKPARRHPSAPFTTSTLQQEASRKLGFAPARTMQLAQRLYEGIDIDGETVGLITYMRTDGVDMAPEAVSATREVIGKEYGARYVPGVPRKYTVKAKNAQEAHEAIRPTDLGRLPRNVRGLEPEQAKLYELIWIRTIASQMESADLERTSVDIVAKASGRTLDLRATGQVVKFDGFLRVYQEGRDDEADEDASLPAMRADEAPSREKIEASQHFTEPPPRFTEATLIKQMEQLSIGRPSTYASTLAVLRDRDYVKIDKKRLVPEDKGRLVIAFLESFFARYVEYDFTASLEEKLDLVSNSEIDWKEVLRDFWRDFSTSIDDIKDLRVTEVLDALNDLLGPHIFPDKGEGSDPRACPACASGKLSLKVGKFGAFIGCSNYPECRFTRPLNPAAAEAGINGERPGVKTLGADPESGADVTVRDGRFGPFIQLGEQGDDKEIKPKRSSLPRGVKPEDVALDMALALLALPREVAKHPETKEPVVAGIGRYGPYVQHQRTYANLGRDDDVLTIGGNRAIDLIVEKESGRGGGRFGGSAGAGRVIGDHPEGGAIALKAGRFGSYVNWGKINATLQKGTNADELTVEAAVALLAAKASGAPEGGGRVVGEYPGHGNIVARDGRYGAYVSLGKVNATLPDGVTLETVSLDDAIALIDGRGGPGTPAKKAGPARKAAKTAAAKKVSAKKSPAKKAATVAKAKPKKVAAKS